ncbi:helix-turn-helix domain-containing protein [Pasteurella multocida]|uniref:XRE family transcriptional regulator n=1 Tax=Pasteurella oralis TaxID=1071947 RepID=A0ABW4NU71_9PAST|nr:XRE family transcriptional regulator [Pasteurella multocida]AFF24634.1 putative transcriptional regulator [Pasteurella multocida subsp. multocida str. HN06]AFF25293.1 transcriptional regulator [Pasteurella multocida subsp. multocida str. HN06]AFI45230.1 repressor protein CI [Pasteurella multocida subsp. multocida str. 3480]ARA88430.1 transcriptional regulator [Pasteurella multocida subsp. septica]AUK48878.1 transcriptional regulator [Pasteurella multocida]
MSKIIDRIKSKRLELRLSQAKLGERIGWNQSRIGNYEAGTREMDDYILGKIAEGLGVTLDWLKYGDQGKVESNVKDIGSFDLWDRNTPLHDEDIEVPFLQDIRLAAGNGFADDIMDYNNFKLRFSKATLRRQGVQYENAVCVVAEGDSMEPAIPDGATVGVDMGNKVIRDNNIYAINHGGLLRIKILNKMPNEQVLIRSFNSTSYPDEIVNLDEIVVIGKVFWYSVLL